MKLDKLVYDIREAVGKYSDDNEISDRYIIYLINTKRSRFLKQELDRFGRKFNNTILQTFCSPVELVSPDECGVDVSCKTIARTSLKIPSLLQLTTRDGISRIAPANKLSKPFTFISRNKAPYALGSIFGDTKTFLHDDDHIYFISPKEVFLFECVSITGIFEDPTELSGYSNCCDCDSPKSCFEMSETEYPITPHLLDLIRTEVINELLNLDKVPEDKSNDSDNA